MPDQTATRKGVASRRDEAMAAIVKNREAIIDTELKDGGTPEGIAVLARDNPAAAGVVVKKPDGVDQAEWDKLDGEAQAGLAEAEAERIRVEAEAAAGAGGESAEAKAAREAKEKEETERKAAEAAAAAGAKKVKIKVDGVEQEVDEDKVRQAGIAALQKESAADRRLEEASRLFREATAAVAAAQGGAVQDPNKDKGGASLPNAGGGGAEVLTDEAFTEAVKKIQYGSEAEAAATLKDLITKAARAGQPEQLTLDRVAEMLDFRDATRWAHEEYKDILGDPKLKALFATEEKRLRAAGDMRPYRELYKDLGDGLREWKKGLAPASAAPQQTAGTSRQALHERKASVVVVPSAAAKREAPPPTKESSPSEVIDQMRKARRQA